MLHDIEETVINTINIGRFVRLGLKVIFERNGLPGTNDADVMGRVEKSGKLFIYAASYVLFSTHLDLYQMLSLPRIQTPLQYH